MTLRTSASLIIVAGVACGRPPSHAITPRESAKPTVRAVEPSPPPPRPRGVARGWETWPRWAALEVSSAAFRARVDDTWGGLAALGHGQLGSLARAAEANPVAAGTYAALRPAIDAARPIRWLVGGGDTWAVLVGANASTGSVPAACERSETAIVCGTDAERRALRDDYEARGFDGVAPDSLHGEQRTDDPTLPSRVVVDARVRDGTLRATIVATPRQAPTGALDAAAIAAASRVQAGSPRVALGVFQGRDTDLVSPIQFDGYPVVTDGYTVQFGEQVFIAQPIDQVAPHLVARWRAESGTRVDPRHTPPDLPKGTRRFHRQTWTHDSGEIRVCAPGPGGGGCRVVGHRPATTTLTNQLDFLVVPADGGTWIAPVGDPHDVTALTRWFAITPAVPAVWTLPAVAAGKLSTSHATLWWAQHLTGTGDLTTELEGHVGAATLTP